MFNYNITVNVEDAPAAIYDLVSTTRIAIMNGEKGILSGRVEVRLNNTFALSIVNNSHAFNDDFEGAATLEVALLKNGKLICDKDGYNELTIINGIDYHRLIKLLKQVCEKKSYNIFKLWVACYALTDSRFLLNDEPSYVQEYVSDLLANKAYLAHVKAAIRS